MLATASHDADAMGPVCVVSIAADARAGRVRDGQRVAPVVAAHEQHPTDGKKQGWMSPSLLRRMTRSGRLCLSVRASKRPTVPAEASMFTSAGANGSQVWAGPQNLAFASRRPADSSKALNGRRNDRLRPFLALITLARGERHPILRMSRLVIPTCRPGSPCSSHCVATSRRGHEPGRPRAFDRHADSRTPPTGGDHRRAPRIGGHAERRAGRPEPRGAGLLGGAGVDHRKSYHPLGHSSRAPAKNATVLGQLPPNGVVL